MTKATPVAYEFYNPETGHAIVDYTEYTHAGTLTPDKGYIKRPLVYALDLAGYLERVKDALRWIDLGPDADDSQRLDWIARQDLSELGFALVQDAPHDGEYRLDTEQGTYYGKTLRAAIDAAMASHA